MILKPRNPLVAAAKFRRAGCHEKTRKAERRAEKMALLRLSAGKGRKPDEGVFSSPRLA